MVIALALKEGVALEAWLVARGRAQFPAAEDNILNIAAHALAERRTEARALPFALPADKVAQKAHSNRIGDFALKKHVPRSQR